MKIKAGIIGAAGYTGGEMLRLLLNHPDTDLVFAQSKSSSGKRVDAVHTDLFGDTDLTFSGEIDAEADVLFLCVGHGDAKRFLEKSEIPGQTKIIDLSQDFRLETNCRFKNRNFVYGLPELNSEAISSSNSVANPGCFATAIQLGLLPLAKRNLLNNDVFTTGITGSTGAGQSLSATSHFSWRSNNIQAYKTLSHQHLTEINQSIGKDLSINFIPWRGDFARGIYVSSLVDCELSIDEVYGIYEKFYEQAAFTHVSEEMICMKQVVNTNKCLIHLEKQGNKLVIHSAIDNLLKGAAGQAVENMNLMFGFNHQSGLKLKATQF